MATATASNFMTVEQVNNKLKEGLENIFKSNRWKELLLFMSRFHNYSFNNTLLIMTQRPTATMVQGYKAWQEVGRHVNQGEKAIRILAPNIKKIEMDKIDPNTKEVLRDSKGEKITEVKRAITGFRMVSVFDVQQTNGKEIPSIRDFISRDLKHDESMKKLYQDFFSHIKEHYDYKIREDETEKGVGGYFNRATNEIVISTNNNQNDTEKFRVLIHEFAHAQLHHNESELKDLPRGHKEAQAESVAYVVSNYYGLDSDDVSLGYIATWAGNMDLAKQAVTEIQSVSGKIIEMIDELQRDKIQEFYSNNESLYKEVSELLKAKHEVEFDKLDKSGKEITQFELLQKNTGIVLSGKLEYSERNDNFLLRTDRNMIIPLSELHQTGNYVLLHKELEKDKLFEVSNFQRIPEQFEVTKIANGRYAVAFHEGKDIVSKEYSTKKEAQHFLNRMALSQSLHEQSFLKSQLQKGESESSVNERLNSLKLQINYDVSNYLSSNKGNTFIPKEQHGSTIGWALIKNPDIRSFDDLKNYAFNQTKYLPNQNQLRDAINNSIESQNNHSKSNEREDDGLELER